MRSVVESTLPSVLDSAPEPPGRVVLLAGDANAGAPVIRGAEVVHEEACDYFSPDRGSPSAVSGAIRRVLRRIAGDDPGGLLVWMHNPGIARNIMLIREVAALADEGARVVFHHHDFWCANRWGRWRDMQACGVDSFARAADLVLPSRRGIMHAVINMADHGALAPSLGNRVIHLPNPVRADTRPPAAVRGGAWAARRFGGKRFWLCPTRFLRRKNLLEALLLVSWLDPGAVLATGSASFSTDEAAYARLVREAAGEGRVQVEFGVLDDDGSPSMAELMPHSAGVLLTSVQEGFGMAFVESAVAGVPLVSRRLPEVEGDLRAAGFAPPNSYDEAWIPRALVDWPAEQSRRARLLHWVRASLPVEAARWLREPTGDGGEVVAFSRLTLEGQRVALANATWEACAPWNPALAALRRRIAGPGLPVAAMPNGGADMFAERFWEVAAMAGRSAGGSSSPSREAQAELTRRALAGDAFFPLLWETGSLAD